FALGTMAGAVGYAALRKPSPERIVYVERSVAPVATATPPEPAPMASGSSDVPRVPAGPRAERVSDEPRNARRARSEASARAARLEAERKLLDSARRALAAGRTEDVL